MKIKSKIIELVCLITMSLFVLMFVLLNLFCPYLYKTYIKKYAVIYGLNPALIASVIYCESGFKKDAKSSKNAVGLMQIMPSTAKAFYNEKGIEFNEEKLFIAEENINIGCWYLNYLFKKYGDETTVLACYNAGEGNVLGWTNGEGKIEKTQIMFKETLNYVNKVQKTRKFYRIIFL